MRVDTITRDYGSTLSMQRTLPKLSLDAFPSYFPKALSFLSIELPVKRKSVDSRRTEIEAYEGNQFEECMSAVTIEDCEKFCAGIENYLVNYSKKYIFRCNLFVCY